MPFPIHPHMLRHACGFKLVPIVWLVSVCPTWLPLSGIMRGAAVSIGVSSKIARKRGRARLRGGRTS